MTVYVVTDSTSCLPPALAAEYGITVLDIHTRGRLRPAGAAAGGEAGEAPAAGTDTDGPDVVDGSADDAAPGGDADGSTAGAGDGDRGTSSGSSEIADENDDPDRKSGPDAAGDRDSDENPTTAGLGPLELTAAYARLLERGGDDGVVAIHLSRELSSTWSSAVQAAAVFDGLVSVLDTRSAGMVLGQAAIAAARRAAAGASLAECTAAAQRVLDGANVWLYVHRLDALARGGRLSTAQRLLSTALAIKPILHLSGGKIELAAKTRTQSKAMNRLVTLAEDAYREIATPETQPVAVGTRTTEPATGVTAAAPDGSADGTAAPVGAPDGQSGPDGTGSDGSADGTATVDAPEKPEKPGGTGEDTDRPRVFTFGGDHEFRLRKRREEPVPLRELPPVAMHLDIHQSGYPDLAEELRETLRADLPESVVISVVDLSPALLVHTGPEAVGITLVRD